VVALGGSVRDERAGAALPMGTPARSDRGYLVGVAVAIFEQYGGLAPELRLFVIPGFGGAHHLSTFLGRSGLC